MINDVSQKIETEPHVMAIGFFDGIHKGHQQLLDKARTIAKKNKYLFSAMTFSPHPNEVIKGDKDHKYLMPLPEKIKRMEEMGVEQLFVVKFDRAFASLDPHDFIKKFILNMNTRHVVVGFDFTFGFKAAGNTTVLQQDSNKQGYGLSVIPKKSIDNEKISTTKIKALIQAGQVEQVSSYLGTDYKVSASIIQDHSSENLKVIPNGKFMLPSIGTYYVEVIQGNKRLYGTYYQYSNVGDDNVLVLDGVHGFSPHHFYGEVVFVSQVKVKETISI